MWCPLCRSEYRTGFLRCSDCDVALVEWLADAGMPDALVPLVNDASPELIAELTDRLEKAEVPYVIQAGTALPILDGETDVLDRPAPWTARIWVTEAMSERAKRILLELRPRG